MVLRYSDGDAVIFFITSWFTGFWILYVYYIKATFDVKRGSKGAEYWEKYESESRENDTTDTKSLIQHHVYLFRQRLQKAKEYEDSGVELNHAN